MNAKELSTVINSELIPILTAYGFKKKTTYMFKAIREFGYDMLDYWFLKYGDKYYIKLVFSRRYDQIETVVGPAMQIVNGINYRNNDTDLTLKFDEYNLDGNLEASSKRYPVVDGNYKNSLEEIKYALVNKFFPFLESIDTIDKLHDFINVPPNTFLPNSSFFDCGDAILRKLVIAKLAGRDFKEVNYSVVNHINKYKIEDPEGYQLYTRAYNGLIVRLNNM